MGNKGTLHHLTCFRASFFPFFLLCWPPLFLPFSRHLFALFSPSKSALFCREKGTEQSLERGSSGMHLATKFEKEIPSRNLREKGQSCDAFFLLFPHKGFRALPIRLGDRFLLPIKHASSLSAASASFSLVVLQKLRGACMQPRHLYRAGRATASRCQMSRENS